VSIVVEDVSVTYRAASGREVEALAPVNLSIAPGEVVTLIGPSGCGKSTLLHTLGGLLRPTRGRIELAGAEMRHPVPAKAAFVFQDYSLFPWRSVLDNVAIGLRFAGLRKGERRSRALRQLELVGLAEFAHAYPSELSGGMQQRVAIARALAMDPEALLMDEPFGALDEQTRRRLGVDVAKLLREAGKTIVLVTHSLDEAIFWADRVLVMSARPGRIVEELVIDEPHPRALEFMTEPRFDRVRVRLFELLNDGAGARPKVEA
jgi:NitT/TauT family transport system ATP-binding protein